MTLTLDILKLEFFKNLSLFVQVDEDGYPIEEELDDYSDSLDEDGFESDDYDDFFLGEEDEY